MARTRKSKTDDTKPTFVTPDGLRVTEIPLATPAYGSKPDGATLLDLIDAQRPRDAAGVPLGVTRADDEEEVEVFGPVMNTLMYVVPVVIVLLWFDVLVHMQYRQDFDWKSISLRCAKSMPGMSSCGIVAEAEDADGDSHVCDPLVRPPTAGVDFSALAAAGDGRGRGLLYGACGE